MALERDPFINEQPAASESIVRSNGLNLSNATPPDADWLADLADWVLPEGTTLAGIMIGVLASDSALLKVVDIYEATPYLVPVYPGPNGFPAPVKKIFRVSQGSTGAVITRAYYSGASE